MAHTPREQVENRSTEWTCPVGGGYAGQPQKPGRGGRDRDSLAHEATRQCGLTEKAQTLQVQVSDLRLGSHDLGEYLKGPASVSSFVKWRKHSASSAAWGRRGHAGREAREGQWKASAISILMVYAFYIQNTLTSYSLKKNKYVPEDAIGSASS